MKLEHIDHVAITVRDVEISAEWYCEVLGLERRHVEVWGDVPTMVCAGATCVALFPSDSANPRPSPDHDTIAMRHFAFRVGRDDFEAAQRQFRETGIEFTFADHQICHSIYIFDPDGHQIEITTYEVGSASL